MPLIISNQQDKIVLTKEQEQILHSLVDRVCEMEGVALEAEVSLVFVTNEEIQRLNAQYRGKDCPTDVLSFPMLEQDEEEVELFPEEEFLLGDIVISLERAEEQAEEYGHSLLREVAFLTVHGLLHLLGYDHESDNGRQVMRLKEEQALSELNITR